MEAERIPKATVPCVRRETEKRQMREREVRNDATTDSPRGQVNTERVRYTLCYDAVCRAARVQREIVRVVRQGAAGPGRVR